MILLVGRLNESDRAAGRAGIGVALRGIAVVVAQRLERGLNAARRHPGQAHQLADVWPVVWLFARQLLERNQDAPNVAQVLRAVIGERLAGVCDPHSRTP